MVGEARRAGMIGAEEAASLTDIPNPWKTEAHWSSWLNLAPKRDVSGGRVIRHVREHRTNRAGNAFRMAAQALIHAHTVILAQGADIFGPNWEATKPSKPWPVFWPASTIDW